MIYSHGHSSSSEPEVIQVVFTTESRVWVDLESVVVTVWGGGGGGGGGGVTCVQKDTGRERECSYHYSSQ